MLLINDLKKAILTPKINLSSSAQGKMECLDPLFKLLMDPPQFTKKSEICHSLKITIIISYLYPIVSIDFHIIVNNSSKFVIFDTFLHT